MRFEEVYEAYGDRILNLAYRLTGDEETARDMTQDVFIKVYENLDDFRGQSHVYTWIYRIAVNHVLNHLKKERRRRWISLLDESVTQALRDDRVDRASWERKATPSSEARLEKDERARVVWSVVQTLPVKYRVPLVFHHYEGMSYKEIAQHMELSLSAVEARIHRAKKQLIKKLEPLLEHL